MNQRSNDEDNHSGIANPGLTGHDKQQDDLQNPKAPPLDTPEGLMRPRQGPLDKNVGRGDRR